MKAILCEQFGPPEALVLADVPEPEPGRGQVAIDVRACGLNFPDVLMLEGKYQSRPDFPFSPGGELAGVVRSVGPQVSGFAPGDRVIARVGHGGLREQALAQAGRCVRMPDALDFPPAAGLLLTYGTAYHALADRAALTAGETLVVLGAAGGVGLAAVELGKLMGARVIAGASTKEKVDLALSRGAEAGFVYPEGPLSREQQRALSEMIKQLTGGGADVMCDPVGGDYAEPALRAMAWEGRYLVIGFAAGAIPSLPLNLLLLKGCDIRGVFYGELAVRDPDRNRQLLADLLTWAAEGRIAPHVSEEFPLARAGEAICLLADRRALGKVIVTIP
ncbi:MAG: NADPH:quinone oxidoreductase [Burkholderiales bacterium 68-12]|nr:MAG: NADPH:quinone oxidoreductase [Burkholderiales bacterium 68-12]